MAQADLASEEERVEGPYGESVRYRDFMDWDMPGHESLTNQDS